MTTYSQSIKGTLVGFVAILMFEVALCIMTARLVLSEERDLSSTPAQVDAQIALMLDNLESALAKTKTVSDDQLETLVSVRLLSSKASTVGHDLLRNFPARLNKRADQEPDALKSVTLRVFADTATAFLTERLPDPAPPPVIAVSPPKAPIPDQRTPIARERTGVDQVNQPTAPARAPTPPASPSHAQSLMERTLLDRGDAMLALGDVSAARLLYARAAETVEIAALKLADTYDAGFLAAHNLRGIKPDPLQAEKWYRKAAEMGEVRAAVRLKDLQGHSTTSVPGPLRSQSVTGN